MEQEQSIDQHLSQALFHLQVAVNHSVALVLENKQHQKDVGHKWESFLAQFFHYTRDKGKEHKVNLLSWISFPRLRH